MFSGLKIHIIMWINNYFFLFLCSITAKTFAIAKLTMQQNTVKLIKNRNRFGLLTIYCPISSE